MTSAIKPASSGVTVSPMPPIAWNRPLARAISFSASSFCRRLVARIMCAMKKPSLSSCCANISGAPYFGQIAAGAHRDDDPEQAGAEPQRTQREQHVEAEEEARRHIERHRRIHQPAQ